MNVNDRFQVDKQERVRDFDRFYLLQTIMTKKKRIEINKNIFLHLSVFDKYNKQEIDAENNRI
jgi:hypothetical protein